MSGRGDREKRREESSRGEAGAERRQQLIKLGSGAAFLALAVVVVLIVISQSQGGGGGGDAKNLEGTAEINRQLEGIPQEGMVLGKPGAAVTVREFGDLQCPFCRFYSEEVLPQIIDNQVRAGEAKLDFANFIIIGPESTPAGAAAVAAGEQGRGWNFIKLFYRNQGGENSDYVTPEFLTAVAKAAGVPDIEKWNRERKSRAILAVVGKTTEEARRLGFKGTPSLAIEGPGTNGLETLGTPESSGALEAAISDAG